MCTDGGEELVFRELDHRFPVVWERPWRRLFELKIMKNETTEAFTARSRIVCARLQTEGANLPSEARVHIVLRGCRLGLLGRATIVSATRRS